MTFTAVDTEPWASHPNRNCARGNPEDWFPTERMARKAADELCEGCPVRTQCLTFAVESGEEFGVWGGSTEEDRRALRRGAAA